jgi:hypothetical protein
MKQSSTLLSRLLVILTVCLLFPVIGSGQTIQNIFFTAPCDSFAIATLPTQDARIRNDIHVLDSTMNAAIVRQAGDKESTAYYHFNFYVDCQGRFVASVLETYEGTMGLATRVLKLLNTLIVWSPALQNETPVNSMVKINVQVRKGRISIQP